MIRRFQALNYRCLRHVDVRLDRFHLLVGANSSGKSAFFDAVAFVSDLVRDGLPSAIGKRTSDFRDLVWGRGTGQPGFQLALEFDLPDDAADQLPAEAGYGRFRYEVSIRESGQGAGIDAERGVLLPDATLPRGSKQDSLFPLPPESVETIVSSGRKRGSRTVFRKSATGTDSIYSEVSERPGKGWIINSSYGPSRSTFGSLPEAPASFPVATRVQRFLERYTRLICLDGERLRSPSPPGLRCREYLADGRNLPWLIDRLRTRDPAAHDEWLNRVRSVQEGILGIDVVEQPGDGHAHVVVKHRSGIATPSWAASEGLLRLLALTLIPYAADEGQLIMLEELERGLHPAAMETVHDLLANAQERQVLASTYSPVLLGRADPETLLCLSLDRNGMTGIVKGSDHPLLKDREVCPEPDRIFGFGEAG